MHFVLSINYLILVNMELWDNFHASINNVPQEKTYFKLIKSLFNNMSSKISVCLYLEKLTEIFF